MPTALACLVATTSGRILLLWDRDATLPFRYPQLAMLLASLFHFSQAQPFCHLQLQNGFTLLISTDIAAQISVAIICATPAAAKSDQDEFSTTVAPLELARLKSLLILQEFVRCYRDDIDRLVAESFEQSKAMAEQYTLSNALDGLEDGNDGTLDEFVVFQSGFVDLVMETTARGILNAIMSWNQEGEVSLATHSSSVRLARGFLMNAETGEAVYSTCPDPDTDYFGDERAFRPLILLHRSARVQQTLKLVAKALDESETILNRITSDNNTSDAALVVRFNCVANGNLNELFVAFCMLPTGVFASGVVFYGANECFRGRESELRSSGELERALAAQPSGSRMLNILRDPAVDVELHIGSDGAPEVVWEAMSLLVRPLLITWTGSEATEAHNDAMACPTESDIHTKPSVLPKLAEYTDETTVRK